MVAAATVLLEAEAVLMAYQPPGRVFTRSRRARPTCRHWLCMGAFGASAQLRCSSLAAAEHRTWLTVRGVAWLGLATGARGS